MHRGGDGENVFIENKFLGNCGKVGHIEDVVVDSKARGIQLGTKVVASAVGLGAGTSAAEMVLMAKKVMMVTTRRATNRFIFISLLPLI
ncbi:hypothetical protein LguiA_013781 [Lonicera macranthoides]